MGPLKSKQTSITTVRCPILSVARLPTPLIFRYPLPLTGEKTGKKTARKAFLNSSAWHSVRADEQYVPTLRYIAESGIDIYRWEARKLTCIMWRTCCGSQVSISWSMANSLSAWDHLKYEIKTQIRSNNTTMFFRSHLSVLRIRDFLFKDPDPRITGLRINTTGIRIRILFFLQWFQDATKKLSFLLSIFAYSLR